MSPSSSTAGSVGIGGTITIAITPGCAFTPGAALNVAVNGTAIPGKTANGSGGASVTVTAVSATQFSVDDPVLTPAQCGANAVTASGPSSVAQGGRASHTVSFTLLCPGVTPGAVTKTSRVALTGANLVRWGGIALALVLIGGLFVAADRRKARARD